MGLEQIQNISQRLVLTQSMRQSLTVLRMGLPELREYLFEQAVPNPLIDIEDAPDLSLPTTEEEERMSEISDDAFFISGSDSADYTEMSSWDGRNVSSGTISLENLAVPSNGFLDMLHEQLLRLPNLGAGLKKLCNYLIECLSDNGYLEFDLCEIAAELDVPLFKMEQALYVLQSLQPAGVGARTLKECLILQLAQSKDFNSYTLKLVKDGLPLLAENDISGLSKLLGCGGEQVKKAACAVRRLEPIPSRGYATGGNTLYQIPDAILHQEGSGLIIEMNSRFLPQMHINTEVGTILKKDGDSKCMTYLQRKVSQAKQLMQCVENRQSTIERLVKSIVTKQRGYFLAGQSLAPMTMSQLADGLGMSISTVSRAVQGKNISFRGKNYPLRKMFTGSVISSHGSPVSKDSVKLQIRRFIDAEDAAHPFSDEKLKAALDAVQLPVSRRTVAKYREELGIPSSNLRKRDS